MQIRKNKKEERLAKRRTGGDFTGQQPGTVTDLATAGAGQQMDPQMQQKLAELPAMVNGVMRCVDPRPSLLRRAEGTIPTQP